MKITLKKCIDKKFYYIYDIDVKGATIPQMNFICEQQCLYNIMLVDVRIENEKRIEALKMFINDWEKMGWEVVKLN